MRKRKYLWHVFLLLNAPVKMRRDVVRELSEMLSDRMEQGRTIDEAIAEIGDAREITDVYNEMVEGDTYRYQVRMVVCILIAALLGILLCIDASELARGYSEIQAMIASNAVAYAAYDIDTSGVIIKMLFETLGCAICIIKSVLYIIKRKEAKSI